jgi:hypothetical protein
MAAALAALALAWIVMLAAASSLGTPDFSIGSGSASSPPAVEAPAGERGTPAWVSDPLASPLERLDPSLVRR